LVWTHSTTGRTESGQEEHTPTLYAGPDLPSDGFILVQGIIQVQQSESEGSVCHQGWTVPGAALCKPFHGRRSPLSEGNPRPCGVVPNEKSNSPQRPENGL
jgi:hypothetical protein